MNTFPVMLGALCVFAIAYRYYSAFLAAKAVVLDNRRTTPAHVYEDGHNYVPSPKWVPYKVTAFVAWLLSDRTHDAPVTGHGY